MVEESAYVVQMKTPRFLEYGPIPVKTQILNRGNYHIKPKGALSLLSLFGKKVDQQLLKEQNIFPDVTRTFENNLGQKWMFGKYKIELNASYGETGKVLTATVFTWVFPWKIALVIILTIVIVILLISLLYHRLKRKEIELEEKLEELEEKLEEKE
jgi:ABC-type multidrug transport system fused ATPase/permease subunit